MKRVAFNDELTEIRCKKECGFKQCSVDGVNITPHDCMECYAHEIIEGKLICECGEGYPVIKGIPRFLPEMVAINFEKIQKTFSYEWKMFRFGERNWGQDISYRKNLFLQGMGGNPSDLEGKLIFDAGCGSGLLSMEMANSFGMEVMALDLAFGIERAYEYNKNPHVHFIQGSVLEPPFRDQVFDYLYCAGVLVALPDTLTGFKAINRTLEKGGMCFIWVYHPIDKNYHPTNRNKMLIYNFIRKNITSRLSINVQYYLYLLLMPLFLFKQKIELLIGSKTNVLTWREKMQALFDMFSPIYQNRHTHDEVIEWYSSEGFSNIHVSDKGPWGFGTRGDLI
jgi:ubiquinone/menaquinone biosynthesis C-methylase UbiE